MISPRSSAVAAVLGLVALTGCDSAQQRLVEQGGRPLTSAETLAHVSGNTEVWTKGGGYYSPDGQIAVVWEGATGSGTWTVTEAAEVCLTVDVFGGTRECHAYVERDGRIFLVYDDQVREPEMRPGNQLASL